MGTVQEFKDSLQGMLDQSRRDIDHWKAQGDTAMADICFGCVDTLHKVIKLAGSLYEPSESLCL